MRNLPEGGADTQRSAASEPAHGDMNEACCASAELQCTIDGSIAALGSRRVAAQLFPGCVGRSTLHVRIVMPDKLRWRDRNTPWPVLPPGLHVSAQAADFAGAADIACAPESVGSRSAGGRFADVYSGGNKACGAVLLTTTSGD